MFQTTRLLLILLFLLAPSLRAQAPMTVHEWGTITSRHLPDGTALGGLNRIDADAVLPPFVHRYEPEQTSADPDNGYGKSPATPGRPDVTMRLETPVIYFHLPKGFRMEPFDVSVSFRGGILNEFFPKAEASVSLDSERINAKAEAGVLKWDGNVLNNYVRGSLVWRGLQFSKFVALPETNDKTWLAPRAAKSEKVMGPSGEGEQYLFYRGVAHLDALVQTQASDFGVVVSAPKQLHWMDKPSMTLKHLWLADVREKGVVAFWAQPNLVISKADASKEIARLPAFSEGEYSAQNLQRLRDSMKRELVGAGLFEDEAEAMLVTWNESYFQKPGLRLFYIVPKEWTDYHLPLNISVPNRMTRVLVGRIDLLK